MIKIASVDVYLNHQLCPKHSDQSYTCASLIGASQDSTP